MNPTQLLNWFLYDIAQRSADELKADIEQAREDCKDAYIFDEELT